MGHAVPWAVPAPLQRCISVDSAHPCLPEARAVPLQIPHSVQNDQTFQEVSWIIAKVNSSLGPVIHFSGLQISHL